MVFLLLLALLLPASVTADEPDNAREIDGPVPDARIEIYKERRQLLLYSGDSLLRRYPMGLGFKPEGTKRKEGDGATPEGEYFVCIKNPNSQYYLSVGLNYPNAKDAERGLTDGLISAEEHATILDAEKRGLRPPWNTKLGGEIFIHGNGSRPDWTWGCVALDDKHMKVLYDAVRIGTRVTIYP